MDEYCAILESTVTYGSKTLKTNQRKSRRLQAVEVDFWMSCRVSRLQYIRNEDIRRKRRVDKTILDKVNTKRVVRYDHMTTWNGWVVIVGSECC